MPVPDIGTISVYAGDDTGFALQLYSAEDTPLNLEGWGEWRATWRATASDPKSVDIPVTTDPTQGLVVLHLPGVLTSSLEGDIRSGVWDVQATRTSDGAVRTFARGSIDWQGDVTR